MKSLIKKVWSFLADFFNPKEWVKLFRSVPAIALTLIVLANVLMNLVAAKSIFNIEANVPTSLFTNGSNMWIIQDAGILVSWIGFLVGDLLVTAFGSKNAIRINIAGLGLSLFVSLLLVGVAHVPGDWSVAFDNAGNLLPDAFIRNASVDGVIGNMWYVILGSAAATFVGILVNNITHGVLLKKMIKKHGDKYFGYFVASGASTVFGQVIDNIVFALLVGVNFFGWSLFSVLMCSLLGALVELVAGMIFTPLTYKISKNWAKNKIGQEWMNEETNKENNKNIKNKKLGKILFRAYLASLAVLIIGGITTVTVTSKHFALKEQETQLRNNILQYTDKMKVSEPIETDEGKDFEYFGQATQATVGIPDETKTIIRVTRFDYNESVKLITIGLFGELTYDERTETDIFTLDEMIFISYDTKTKNGYQVSLRAVGDPIEIGFDDYVSSLRSEIEYVDINTAMTTLLEETKK